MAHSFFRFAFFTDEGLNTPYNTVGYDPKTGESSDTTPVLPDDQLLNEVYVAFAARFPWTAINANVDLSMDGGFFKGPLSVYDVTLRCSYKALHVDYTWFNGTIRELSSIPAPNGTISEIWHGRHIRQTISGESPTLEQILQESALEASSVDFAHTWANLYSTAAMATIGGVSSARANLSEQTRNPTLVVKVWIPALVFLACSCLNYVVAGYILAVLAVQTASRGNIKDAKVRLSIVGIVDWAVTLALAKDQEREGEAMVKEQEIKGESEAMGLLKGSRNNFYLKVFHNDNGTGGSSPRQLV